MAISANIGFIGGGNMAAALAGGLVKQGGAASRITVAEPRPDQQKLLAERFGVQVTSDNQEAARNAELVIFAVKPQVFEEVARPLAAVIQARRPLVLSIAAGIPEADIRRWLGEGTAIVRAMPNTASLLGAGAAALYANPKVSASQRELAAAVLGAVGSVHWLADESLLDAVTALSASGLAYFFLLMEAMEASGQELNLPAEVARALTLQTALGAARMAQESGEDPATLRQRVTSPGGTTAAALKIFEQGDFRGLVRRALTAARDRGRELSHKNSGDKT